MYTLVRSGSLVLALLALFLGDFAAGQEKGKSDDQKDAEVKKINFGQNVTLEIQGDKRRVLINTKVCRNKDQLEQFMCRKNTKEHESILTGDFDARSIHAALLAAGAEAGSPIKFRPKLTPPTGTVIKVSVQYKNKDGKMVTHPAQDWIRYLTNKKPLTHDWVFAGSVLIPDPFDKTKEPFYGANYGDVICVANFDTALLDLPITSSKDNDDLAFEAHTERIPAEETPVVVILEPVLKEKKK